MYMLDFAMYPVTSQGAWPIHLILEVIITCRMSSCCVNFLWSPRFGPSFIMRFSLYTLMESKLENEQICESVGDCVVCRVGKALECLSLNRFRLSWGPFGFSFYGIISFFYRIHYFVAKLALCDLLLVMYLRTCMLAICS